MLLAIAALLGCQARDPRPSFLLIVLDTVRVDAVSAYGNVDGTTPHFDALAANGLRYENAFAPAPWTLPSHATLLTGLPPVEHGVGIGGRMGLPDELTTLAERLTEAGYETVGFSENALVAGPHGFARGFSHFESQFDHDSYKAKLDREQISKLDAEDEPAHVFDLVLSVALWAERRDKRRPFFVFVNLFGAHDPYELDEDHLFLPPGVELERAAAMRTGGFSKGVAEAVGICDRLPSRDDLAVLKGLYLGDVAAVDEKLGKIQRELSEASDGLVTIATSDHGEHLGEHRLLGHEFSLRDAVLRVPLAVHGLPDAKSAVISAPVGLAEVAASILAWAGVGDAPGQRLPEAAGVAEAAAPGVQLALFSDRAWLAPDGIQVDHGPEMDRRRRGCRPDDRVFGDMLSVIDFPWKLIWYEHHPAQLYDLSWDAQERSDVAQRQPEVVERLSAKLAPLQERLRNAEPGPPLDPDSEKALRALGYID